MSRHLFTLRIAVTYRIPLNARNTQEVEVAVRKAFDDGEEEALCGLNCGESWTTIESISVAKFTASHARRFPS